MSDRCVSCYRRIDATHRVLGRCPSDTPGERPVPKSRAGYVPPSRRGRVPLADWLAMSASPHGSRRQYTNGCRCRLCDTEGRAANNAYVRAWKARRKAAAGG